MNLLLFAFSLIAAFVYPFYDQAIIKEMIFLPIGLSFLAWSMFENKDWLHNPGSWLGLWLVLNVYSINGEFLKWLGCLGIFFYVRNAKRVKWPLLIGGLLIVAYNLFLVNGNSNVNHFGGSLVNANNAGGYWLMYSFLFVAFGWNFIAGTSLFLLYFSSCRSAVIGLAAGLLALLIAYRPRLGSFLLVLAVAGGAFYWALPLQCVPLADRYLFYQGTIDMISSHWIVGYGVGSFSAIFPIFADPGLYAQYGVNFFLLHAHNFILELWAEQGIIGLGLFVWFVAWCISKAQSLRDYFLSAGVIAALVYSWTSAGLNYVPALPLFFVILALIGKEEDTEMVNLGDYFYNR